LCAVVSRAVAKVTRIMLLLLLHLLTRRWRE
jgi:hypothetical protein